MDTTTTTPLLLPSQDTHNQTPPQQSLNPNFHIITPRLYISHITPSSDKHCNLFYALRSNYSNRSPYTMKDIATVRTVLQTAEERMRTTGWGRFIVSLRPSESDASNTIPFQDLENELMPIGVVSMQQDRHMSVSCPKIPDVGFNFLKEFQGRGYAGEAAEALMAWYRENKGCAQFAGLTEGKNEGAKKLLARLGFVDRGVRSVSGVVVSGEATELSVWTLGVGGTDEDLVSVEL